MAGTVRGRWAQTAIRIEDPDPIGKRTPYQDGATQGRALQNGDPQADALQDGSHLSSRAKSRDLVFPKCH